MKKTVDGLILREIQVGESDKLLTVLTGSEGKLLVTAKGVRSIKNSNMSLCQVFNYINLEYYEKFGRRWFSGGFLNRGFFELNQDVDGFALAAYLLSVAEEITGEGVEATEILRMTLNTLHTIVGRGKPLPQIKAVYEWFAAVRSGYEPDLSGCAECGEGNGDRLWLDVMNGSLICGACLRKRSGGLPIPETDAYSARNILLPLDGSVLAALRYIATAPLERIFAFSISSEDSFHLLNKVTETYLINHLERNFDSLEFYHAVVDTPPGK